MKTKKRILTGDRPTGPLHIGHYTGSLQNRVRYQDEYDCFFIIADYQVLTDHVRETAGTEESIRNIVLDWLSVGMDPEKSTFFIQSRIPEIAELNLFFSMLVTVSRLERNPTVKEEFKASGMRSISYGFLGYPVSQAADILIVRPDFIPVGDDQLPHIEQTREIARTFNKLFGEVFPVPEPVLGEVARLPGLNGGKMGKSLANAVYLSDPAQVVEEKIKLAVTDPARIRAADKGHPDICNVFTYHLAFNAKEVSDIENDCINGKIGCVDCKRKAASVINEFLGPVREKRKYFENRNTYLGEIIGEGNERVRSESKKTIGLVREVMHFDYRDLLKGEKIAA